MKKLEKLFFILPLVPQLDECKIPKKWNVPKSLRKDFDTIPSRMSTAFLLFLISSPTNYLSEKIASKKPRQVCNCNSEMVKSHKKVSFFFLFRHLYLAWM